MAFCLPGNDKEHTADPQIGQQDVDPDVRGHRIKEREEASVGAVGSPVQDTDASVQKGFGEVNNFLTDKGDGERSHGQVGSLEDRKQTYVLNYV